MLFSVTNTYGEATDGSAVGAFMGSSLVTPIVKLCGSTKPCTLFEGLWKGGVGYVTEATLKELDAVKRGHMENSVAPRTQPVLHVP